MTSFDNKYNLFLDAKTNQYGRHMVMSNVQKQTMVKYVNIDTKFRDEYNETQTTNTNSDMLNNQLDLSNYSISMPEKINDVKSISVTNIEIPMSFYNISANIGNNYFKVIVSNVEKIITIDDGNYSDATLQNALNTQLSDNEIDLVFTISSNSKCNAVSGGVEIHFDINSSGINDKYRFKSKLGWLLGFRNTSYTLSNYVPISSECFINLYSTKYLYLAIDDFNRGSQNSFISPLFDSLVNKNIVARIAIDNIHYPFGSLLPANRQNGLLISDTRLYTSKVNMQKLNISLLNEDGKPIILNGLDFSFCLEFEHE